MNEKQIKKYFSELAKQSHKKNPRSKEFYQKMVNKRWDKVRADKEAEVVPATGDNLIV